MRRDIVRCVDLSLFTCFISPDTQWVIVLSSVCCHTWIKTPAKKSYTLNQCIIAQSKTCPCRIRWLYRHYVDITDARPVLVCCWDIVCDAGPTAGHNSVSSFLRCAYIIACIEFTLSIVISSIWCQLHTKGDQMKWRVSMLYSIRNTLITYAANMYLLVYIWNASHWMSNIQSIELEIVVSSSFDI